MNKEFKQVNIWLWSLDSLSSPTFMVVVMKNCQVIRAHLCWSWYNFTSIIAVAYIKLSWLEFCLLYLVPEYFLSPSLFPFFSPSNIIFSNVIYYSFSPQPLCFSQFHQYNLLFQSIIFSNTFPFFFLARETFLSELFSIFSLENFPSIVILPCVLCISGIFINSLLLF